MINEKQLLRIINKYKCFQLHFDEMIFDRITYNDLLKRSDKNSLLSQINTNSVILILGENLFVVPKLAVLKWRYFNTLINNWSKKQEKINDCYIIDVTNLFIDSIPNMGDYNYTLIHTFNKVLKDGMTSEYSSDFVQQYHIFLGALLPN
tara:strand:+ start:387 stop:833 length:447 start_codon:yes stop_codon:yes gene_type:complete